MLCWSQWLALGRFGIEAPVDSGLARSSLTKRGVTSCSANELGAGGHDLLEQQRRLETRGSVDATTAAKRRVNDAERVDERESERARGREGENSRT